MAEDIKNTGTQDTGSVKDKIDELKNATDPNQRVKIIGELLRDDTFVNLVKSRSEHLYTLIVFNYIDALLEPLRNFLGRQKALIDSTTSGHVLRRSIVETMLERLHKGDWRTDIDSNAKNFKVEPNEENVKKLDEVHELLLNLSQTEPWAKDFDDKIQVALNNTYPHGLARSVKSLNNEVTESLAKENRKMEKEAREEKLAEWKQQVIENSQSFFRAMEGWETANNFYLNQPYDLLLTMFNKDNNAFYDYLKRYPQGVIDFYMEQLAAAEDAVVKNENTFYRTKSPDEKFYSKVHTKSGKPRKNAQDVTAQEEKAKEYEGESNPAYWEDDNYSEVDFTIMDADNGSGSSSEGSETTV